MSKHTCETDELETPYFRRSTREKLCSENDVSFLRIDVWLSEKGVQPAELVHKRRSFFGEEGASQSFDLSKNPLFVKRKVSKVLSAE